MASGNGFGHGEMGENGVDSGGDGQRKPWSDGGDGSSNDDEYSHKGESKDEVFSILAMAVVAADERGFDEVLGSDSRLTSIV